MFNKILSSPILARIMPFAAFAVLTVLQGRFGDAPQYWIYALKTAIGAWLLWLVRPYVKEMHWKFSWEAAVVGVAVFAAWVGLEGHYTALFTRARSFNPAQTFGLKSPLALMFIAVRMIGSSLVVPPLEEVFYRSFIYRYLIRSSFEQIPLGRLQWRAFLIAGLIFGVAHYEWLPGILCHSHTRDLFDARIAWATQSPHTQSPISCSASG